MRPFPKVVTNPNGTKTLSVGRIVFETGNPVLIERTCGVVEYLLGRAQTYREQSYEATTESKRYRSDLEARKIINEISYLIRSNPLVYGLNDLWDACEPNHYDRGMTLPEMIAEPLAEGEYIIE